MPTGEAMPDQCSACHQPLEIAAVSFSLFKPCRALFVCTSCGLTFPECDQQDEGKTSRFEPFKVIMSWVENARRLALCRGSEY
jgi:hypothetical protein